jgi:hypothetical protein
VIVSFPFISRNIPPVPAYGVYISQLICYSRACAQYSDFLDRAQLLTQKLLVLIFLCCRFEGEGQGKKQTLEYQ